MIHLFKMGDTRIVLDVPTGVIHEVDEMAWDVLTLFDDFKDWQAVRERFKKRYPPKDIEQVINELQSLIDHDILYSKEQLVDYTPNTDDVFVKALCLHIAHDCNMRCKYCFASTGKYYGGKRELMKLQVGKQAIDFVIANSGTRKHLEIDFFGGEPLLGFTVIKELVLYGNRLANQTGKVIRYSLTTNGLLINDEVISFVDDNDIQVIMSLDGRPTVHNQMRPLIGGQPSHDIVVKKFKKMIDSGHLNNYHIRGTFTANNLDFCKDIEHILDLGFKHISMEPVVCDSEKEYALNKEHLPIIFQQYEELMALYEQRHRAGDPFTFFHFEVDLSQGPCLAKRLTGCGAGFDYLAVAPNGDLYPCHQFVGINEFKMGNVRTPQNLNHDVVKQFHNAHIYAKEECLECWAKYYCSGGCHAHAYFSNNDILKPNKLSCAMQKKRIECSLALKAKLMGRDE